MHKYLRKLEKKVTRIGTDWHGSVNNTESVPIRANPRHVLLRDRKGRQQPVSIIPNGIPQESTIFGIPFGIPKFQEFLGIPIQLKPQQHPKIL